MNTNTLGARCIQVGAAAISYDNSLTPGFNVNFRVVCISMLAIPRVTSNVMGLILSFPASYFATAWK